MQNTRLPMNRPIQLPKGLPTQRVTAPALTAPALTAPAVTTANPTKLELARLKASHIKGSAETVKTIDKQTLSDIETKISNLRNQSNAEGSSTVYPLRNNIMNLQKQLVDAEKNLNAKFSDIPKLISGKNDFLKTMAANDKYWKTQTDAQNKVIASLTRRGGKKSKKNQRKSNKKGGKKSKKNQRKSNKSKK